MFSLIFSILLIVINYLKWRQRWRTRGDTRLRTVLGLGTLRSIILSISWMYPPNMNLNIFRPNLYIYACIDELQVQNLLRFVLHDVHISSFFEENRIGFTLETTNYLNKWWARNKNDNHEKLLSLCIWFIWSDLLSLCIIVHYNPLRID